MFTNALLFSPSIHAMSMAKFTLRIEEKKTPSATTINTMKLNKTE